MVSREDSARKNAKVTPPRARPRPKTKIVLKRRFRSGANKPDFFFRGCTQMNDSNSAEPFYLSRGGLLYRLILWMRLLDEDRYHVWRRIAILVGVAWLPLVILSAITGTITGSKIGLPFLSDPGPYARYLFALPLLVAAGSIIDPLLASVVQHFWSSGLLPNEEQDRYKDALLQMRRRRDSLWVEVVMIALAFLLAWSLVHGKGDTSLEEGASSWMRVISGEESRLSPAAWWYLLVSSPLFQLMFYRWFWRFLIWAGFLPSADRFSRIKPLTSAYRTCSAGLSDRRMV